MDDDEVELSSEYGTEYEDLADAYYADQGWASPREGRAIDDDGDPLGSYPQAGAAFGSYPQADAPFAPEQAIDAHAWQ